MQHLIYARILQLSRQLFLTRFHKTRKGGWLGGSIPAFHTATGYFVNSPKYVALVLSVELKWVGGGMVPGWVTSTHTKSRNLKLNHKQRQYTSNTNIYNKYIPNTLQKQRCRHYRLECGREGWMGGRARDLHTPNS